MKKRWLIGCGLLGLMGLGLFAGLGALAIGGAFALTRPVVNASEQFLDLLGQGKIAEAYAHTADGFRAQQDEASFTRAVRQLGLTDFASVSWHSRQIENQEGMTEGTVTTKRGGTKPVSLRLIWERGRWAIVAVRFGGIDLAMASHSVPAEPELERLVAESLLGFNQAVRRRDFTAFHGTLADELKHEVTPRRLQEVFQEFIDKDIDIGAIRDLKPRVAAGTGVKDRGILLVAGRYPTSPAEVRFELKYIQQQGAWKLIGIKVNVDKADTAKV